MSKNCIQCGHPLNNYQKKFCSKKCESLYKKDKKVGSYNSTRIKNIQESKKKNYYKKYIEPHKKLINNLLNLNYINNISLLKRRFAELSGENSNILNIYLKDNPDILKNIKSRKTFPLEIQAMDEETFLRLQKDLQEKVEKETIINNYSISELTFKNVIKILNIDYNLKGVFLEKNLISLYEKGLQNYFKQPMKFSNRKQYEDYIDTVRAKFGCSKQIIKDFLKYYKIHPIVEYSEFKKIEKLSSKLEEPAEYVKKLVENLSLITNYFELHKKFELLFNKYYKIYYSLYKDNSRSNLFQEFQKDIESSNSYFKELRLECSKKYTRSEYLIRMHYGDSLITQFLAELENCENFEEWILLKKKYIELFRCTRNNFPDSFRKAFPKIRELDNLNNKNTISEIGGSSIERRLRDILVELKIPFEQQISLKSLTSKYGTYHIDFVLNKKDCIEVQGDYWHSNPIFYNHAYILYNSIYPQFKYKNRPIKNKKEINSIQKEGLQKDNLKRKAIEKKFGKDHLYYIWEYDINHHIDKVIKFLKEKFINE